MSAKDDGKEASKEIKIVLIGPSGVGKSSVGNMILEGKKKFTTGVSANSVTTKCQSFMEKVDKQKITVIDTPDFFDTENEEEMRPEIIRAMVECAGGIHAFVIVLYVGKYTRDVEKMLKQLKAILTVAVLEHTVILFTHGDQLGKDQSGAAFVETNQELEEFVGSCACYHIIDNKYWKASKIKKARQKLLETINDIIKNHGCYSNELLQKAKENIKAEKNAEKATDNVCAVYLRRLARIAPRALLEAFLGGFEHGISELTRFISKSLDNLAGNMGGEVGVVSRIGTSMFKRGYKEAVTAWKAEDANSAYDCMSEAETRCKDVINLMESAQTMLEDAKKILTVKKKKTC